MRYLLIVLLLSTVGCSTVVPVTAKFPEAPTDAMVDCPALQLLQDDAKLSDVVKTVATNYGSYNECSVKVSTWKEWYQQQKKIFEEISK